jgi:hypothetical protein
LTVDVEAVEPTVKRDFQVILPGALTSIACSPGSIGSGVPQSGWPSSVPSRVTWSPVTPPVSTRMVTRVSLRSSAEARSRATCSRSAWPAAFVDEATSTKLVQALAVRPRRS